MLWIGMRIGSRMDDEGRALRLRRFHFEISRRGLAEHTGIPESRLEAIETGRKQPKPKHVRKLVAFMFDKPIQEKETHALQD
jgi:predicted transcriptional regulator